LIRFSTTILQFAEQGEKTGWSYIEIPVDIAQRLKPGNKKSFRVKGKLDQQPISGVALLPMGGGNFIMALNAAMRKQIRKGRGAILSVQLEVDEKKIALCPELLECLADEPRALQNFNKLPGSHRLYYSRWIENAKTASTRAKRIARAVTSLSRGLRYNQMLRAIDNNGMDR